MRQLLPLFLLLLAAVCYGQRTDTFAVIKPASKTRLDTFILRTYLFDKIERVNHIIYRTGIKIIGPNTLILFKATQSILDSVGIQNDKNASSDLFYKEPYYVNGDSMFFMHKQQQPAMRRRSRPVTTTRVYSGLYSTAIMLITISESTDNGGLPATTQTDVLRLFKEELLIRKR
ncbi:MAG: hypothetical protein RLZZ367_199 [Bacteroidota bacterium]|jgi:hypothetical protein